MGEALHGREALSRGVGDAYHSPVLISIWLRLKKVLCKAAIETSLPYIPII